MKKTFMTVVAISLFSSSTYVLADAQVVMRSKPVPLVRQGDTWVVPADTTADYYSYTDNGADYICSATEPRELVGTKYTNLKIMMGNNPSDVVCYKSTYFVSP